MVSRQINHSNALYTLRWYPYAQNACHENGYEVDPEIVKIFTEYRKTHNQGVFDAYTPEMRAARKSGIITGLPDAYGRGRIIGDYRRVALYGTDWLIADKKEQLATSLVRMTGDNIRLREELSEQIRALGELAKLGEILRIRYYKTSFQCKRGYPVVILWIPCSC